MKRMMILLALSSSFCAVQGMGRIADAWKYGRASKESLNYEEILDNASSRTEALVELVKRVDERLDRCRALYGDGTVATRVCIFARALMTPRECAAMVRLTAREYAQGK